MFDDLIAQKLVVKKRTPDGLNVFKYTRKVFYDNLWNKDARLLDARGIALDDDNNIVQLPFKKIYNFGENGTLVNRDRKVIAVRKINGFLGVITWHKDKPLVSTTGSTTSNYVEMAAKHLSGPKLNQVLKDNPDKSFMFEICDPLDEHIVPEKPGAYLIGARKKEINSPLCHEAELDALAEILGDEVMRPEIYVDIFGNIKKQLDKVKHEGYLIRDFETEEPLCKLKSPHYLSKKGLMRLGQGKVDLMWKKPEDFKQRLDEEFYGVFEYIIKNYTADQWKETKELDRRKVIEQYFENI